MASKYAQGLFLLATASILAVAMANKNFSSGTGYWNNGFNYTNWGFKHPNVSRGSNRIVVGGSEGWHFGFNYADWAIKNAPFYWNDTLVFKYDPPSANNTRPHSVYLFSNLWSFLTCDLRRAKRIAGTTQGGGQGFEFVLKRWEPHFFACGESNGFHCTNGTMKFFVMPLMRGNF
ncbi:unnamed protein product [Ilex paraguariensis]|uniref:Phytocyanin domain-containing protein n=1 Tax=Ilex paraguariensis TaxID=185542 RepID=A0ABC8UFC0_9AQUA